MSRKKTKLHSGGKTTSRWTPFEKATPYRDGQDLSDLLLEHETFWVNSYYTVHKTLLDGTEEGSIHLSIRHNDRRAVRDWRHFQRIKNELAGPEREGVEVFPPESQLVDTANQYHIFVLPEGNTSPYTWRAGRRVSSNPDSPEIRSWIESMGHDPDLVSKGAVQRPIEESPTT